MTSLSGLSSTSNSALNLSDRAESSVNVPSSLVLEHLPIQLAGREGGSGSALCALPSHSLRQRLAGGTRLNTRFRTIVALAAAVVFLAACAATTPVPSPSRSVST